MYLFSLNYLQFVSVAYYHPPIALTGTLSLGFIRFLEIGTLMVGDKLEVYQADSGVTSNMSVDKDPLFLESRKDFKETLKLLKLINFL